ncbi:DNA LIGASE 6 [Raphanus sativus]|uniref:DNA ligase 6 n=1 Tax=Raphanus sativus TaxID=3726 RepID=A0A6J0KEG0_RAPSA|nr:DNA ligase 6 [Raphanus sativus]KAJ4882618.1 DNA LIGASE 6 [Raphanus sativus]
MGDENLADKVSLQGSCGKDEIVEELRYCLPKWVTQEQVTDMVRGTCRNVVEIVDDFYEHETVFYEQVPTDVISFTSRDGFGSGNHEALVSKLELLNCETERDEKSCQSSQFLKLKSMTSSQKSSLSPVKRNRKTKAKPKKKGKAFSKFESAGPKQASITKFFNKVPSDDTKT